MIRSMTGFASGSIEIEHGTLSMELRSVNNRYLEIQFRLPEELRSLEAPMRELVTNQLNRGKVDCRMAFTPHMGGKEQLQLNQALLLQLAQLNHEIQMELPNSACLSVSDILQWPGMLGPEGPSVDMLKDACLALAKIALDDLSATRQREGEKLKSYLLERIDQMEQIAAIVAPHIPQLIAAHQEKLAARLREAMANSDDDRIRQELAMFAQKIDVDEELSRLQTHIAEVRRVLNKGGAVGRRLDFLMQELNREANTLGAKSVATETSQVSMDMKVLIEQMREQIQNIE